MALKRAVCWIWTASCLFLLSCLFGDTAGTVEQRLIIDLGKGSGSGGGGGGESSSENTGNSVRSKAPRRFRAEGSSDSLDGVNFGISSTYIRKPSLPFTDQSLSQRDGQVADFED